MNGGKDIGNGMKHPTYDMDTLRANGTCSRGKNAIPKGNRGGKWQEPKEVRVRSPRSNAKAQYSMHVFARERVQWLISKWEDILLSSELVRDDEQLQRKEISGQAARQFLECWREIYLSDIWVSKNWAWSITCKSGLVLEFYSKTDNRGADLFNCKDAKRASMKLDIDMELDAVEDTLKSLRTQMWKRGWLRIQKLHEDCRAMKMLNVVETDGKKYQLVATVAFDADICHIISEGGRQNPSSAWRGW